MVMPENALTVQDISYCTYSALIVCRRLLTNWLRMSKTLRVKCSIKSSVLEQHDPEQCFVVTCTSIHFYCVEFGFNILFVVCKSHVVQCRCPDEYVALSVSITALLACAFMQQTIGYLSAKTYWAAQ